MRGLAFGADHDFGGLAIAQVQIRVGHLDLDAKGPGGVVGGAREKAHLSLDLMSRGGTRGGLGPGLHPGHL